MGPMGISTLDPVYIGLSTQADGKQLTVPDSHASLPIPAETPSCPGPPPPPVVTFPNSLALLWRGATGASQAKDRDVRGCI